MIGGARYTLFRTMFFFFGNRDGLTPEDVAAICAACRSFSRLRSFSINSDCFTCDKISDWPQLSQIEELQVGSVRLSDADLAIIGRMTGLKSLKIGYAKISSDGIAHLARLPRLESLTFESVTLNISRLKNSQGFGALKSLIVDRSPDVADDAILSFGSLPQLEDVNFQRTSVGDRGLARLLQSGKVRSLIIGEGQVTDGGMALLANHTAPGWLVLSHMPLTDAGLKALAGKEFPTLILDHTETTDEAFRELAEIKVLDFVSLSDTKITGTGASYLRGDQALAHLDLSGAALTPAGIAALAKVKASALDLSRTKIDDKQLMLFADTDKINSLNVAETQVTAEGVRSFYIARERRLQSVGREEALVLECDFPEVAEPYLPGSAFGGAGTTDSSEPPP
jgi:hypothetical protein